ncbi:hypothetical protein GCM10017771_96710 [Streptomyces capitiformicae]|uniref:Uncharacterized protein n=1 Tax=Streptomyces capitiformicae TaxID=2014920 RepID=A0A918ZVS7_9ACTN|nr:hypothetical protein GCM10017771_96710 [Streptomyces capitiformicae]
MAAAAAMMATPAVRRETRMCVLSMRAPELVMWRQLLSSPTEFFGVTFRPLSRAGLRVLRLDGLVRACWSVPGGINGSWLSRTAGALSGLVRGLSEFCPGRVWAARTTELTVPPLPRAGLQDQNSAARPANVDRVLCGVMPVQQLRAEKIADAAGTWQGVSWRG